MLNIRQDLQKKLDDICSKYHNTWKINGADYNKLSGDEIEEIATLLTRFDQVKNPNNSYEPISDAPNSDIVYELLGRLMIDDTKNKDELISDLTSTLRNNAVNYYTNSGRIQEELKRGYEIYLLELDAIDTHADDAYDDIAQAAIDGAH